MLASAFSVLTIVKTALARGILDGLHAGRGRKIDERIALCTGSSNSGVDYEIEVEIELPSLHIGEDFFFLRATIRDEEYQLRTEDYTSTNMYLSMSKYPPAKPGALSFGPLKAA